MFKYVDRNKYVKQVRQTIQTCIPMSLKVFKCPSNVTIEKAMNCNMP